MIGPYPFLSLVYGGYVFPAWISAFLLPRSIRVPDLLPNVFGEHEPMVAAAPHRGRDLYFAAGPMACMGLGPLDNLFLHGLETRSRDISYQFVS